MPYRHYKGGAYTIVGEGLIEADMTPVVVYRADRDPGMLWVRTREVFEEPVSTPNGTVPRFVPDWPDWLAPLDFLPRASVLQALALYEKAPCRLLYNRRYVLKLFEIAAQRGVRLSKAQALAALVLRVMMLPGCDRGVIASAGMLRTIARDVEQDVREHAQDILLDSRFHEPRAADSATVLDLSLFWLAAEPEAFDRYTAAYVEESPGFEQAEMRGAYERIDGDEAIDDYPTDPETASDVRFRYAETLLNFAKRERIFFTGPFADWETPARSNILRLAKQAGIR